MFSHGFLHRHCISERCNGRGNLLGLIVTMRGRKLCSKLHESTNASFCCSFEKEYTIRLIMLHTTATSCPSAHSKGSLARLTMAGSVLALVTGSPLKSDWSSGNSHADVSQASHKVHTVQNCCQLLLIGCPQMMPLLLSMPQTQQNLKS